MPSHWHGQPPSTHAVHSWPAGRLSSAWSTCRCRRAPRSCEREHPHARSRCRSLPHTNGPAARHGTFVAGILSGRRSSPAPAICPGCTLIVQPIFRGGSGTVEEAVPTAAPEDLAAGIVELVDAGVWVLNLSVAISGLSPRDEGRLRAALDYAMRRETLVVVAAGNHRVVGAPRSQSILGSSPWRAFGLQGQVLALRISVHRWGKRGLGAPGECVTSLMPDGTDAERTGTSVAAPFVTGAIALLWSQRPRASATTIKSALLQSPVRGHRIVPPLLDAWGAYLRLREQT